MARILILGGTRFLGRHLAQAALQAGHQLTLLHRGRSDTGLFPQAQHLIADRDHNLAVLQGQDWDAAIDTSAYLPRQVRQAAAALAGRVGHYHLVSTISVYASFATSGTAENAALRTLPEPDTETVDGSTYGGLKALCEAQAQAQFHAEGALGARCLISRPGLLVGPYDPTGRFAWWVQRLLRGGEVLAPGDPTAPVQFIDARDVAAWALLQAERGTSGVFNVSGPDQPLTMGHFLHTAQTVLNPQARLRWVSEDFLQAQQVTPWSDLPVWLDSAHSNMHRVDCSAARAAGLRCRTLRQTLVDTAAWCRLDGETPSAAATAAVTSPGPARPAVGLAAAREAQLLQAWSAQRGD